ncbi:DUF4360 domain-containing protein [Bdellovibrio bacteriovorus]|uniref:Secreted protein n=1 Tax=Bdellovibrio bacteriovorus TaxID=959 RepID=A0A150WFI1_BDEBC|nr:DUF4360 domain-containing protein [Bdellovibrio bacteriovorus]KYG61887.1 hypothetical protein AZI85_06650 [Bdellovibrio bacteriovorus]
MKKMMLMGLLGVMSALSLQANAQVRLGEPAYGGTGCPAGSASVTLSPDQQALSILFDNYVAEAGGGRRIDRKSCNISVPVHVPSGYSVSIFQVDYRGFNSVPRGGLSRFDAEYFWAGARGPRVSRTFMGPVSDVYTISDGLIASAQVWSPCGASVNLRINTSMMAQANSRGEQTLATVDSADVTSGLIYHLRWQRCR